MSTLDEFVFLLGVGHGCLLEITATRIDRGMRRVYVHTISHVTYITFTAEFSDDHLNRRHHKSQGGPS